MKRKLSMYAVASFLCVLAILAATLNSLSATAIQTIPAKSQSVSNTVSTSLGYPAEYCISPQPNLFVPDNYSSIQEAIEYASEGDVIFVRPGVYYERPSIWKNVTLIGSNPENTIIDGSEFYPEISYLPSEDAWPVVAMYANGSGLVGFTISNGDIGVKITPSGEENGYELPENHISNVVVRGNLFFNITLEAIRAESCVNCVIEGNTCSVFGIHAATGIKALNGTGNSISSNTLEGDDVGINVTGHNDNIKYNHISDGIHGIIVSGGSGDAIEFNTVLNGSGNSISLIGCEGFLVRGNEIGAMRELVPEAPAGLNGIVLENCTMGGHILDNFVEGQSEAGVLLRNSQNIMLEGTEALGNAIGIKLEMSSGNEIVGSKMRYDQQGLMLIHSDNNRLLNSILRNCEFGIVFDHSNGNSMLFNLILLNEKGVVLSSSSGLTFDTNFLQRNELGLLSQGSSLGTIRQSIFLLNQLDIQLEESGSFTIVDNFFAHSRVGVVLLDSSSVNQVFHNLFVTLNVPAVDDGLGMWDNGAEGNYWSAYSGRDEDGDGIGDVPFNGLDRYPLTKIGYVESESIKDIIQDLREEIVAYLGKVVGLSFGEDLTLSLFAKIDAAEKSYFKNSNVGAAQNQLKGLINQINALKNGGLISSAAAETLIAKINRIINLMRESDDDFDDLSYEEEKTIGTSPTSWDTDGDGMSDGWEAANGLNPLNKMDALADQDGDGVSNRDEYLNYRLMAEFSGALAGVTTTLIEEVEHFARRLLGTAGETAFESMDIPYDLPHAYVIISYIDKFHGNIFFIDSDGDGLNDQTETSIGTDPNDWDTDGDHMSDGWEVTYEFDPKFFVLLWDPSDKHAFYMHMYGDFDSDGIGNRYEYWLTQMFALGNVNYLVMDPNHKDLIVHVDWVPSFEPDWARLDVVKTPFNNHAITLHIIRGSEQDSKYAVFSGTDPNDYYQSCVDLLHTDPRGDMTRTWKGLMRFSISVDDLGYSLAYSGMAYAIPNDMFAFAHCADSGWVATCTSAQILGKNVATTPQCAVAGTFMHELGHDLGLYHGGNEDVNYKENYDSIMNYRYQCVGIDVTGDHEGDGGTKAATEVVNYSDGSHGTGDFDDWTYVISHLHEIPHNGP